MKKVIGATFALALALAAAAPASAEPARASSASAFGLSVTLLGTELIGPTPTAAASQPPDRQDGPNTVIDLPVPPLLINGTISATAIAHRESDIRVSIPNPSAVPEESDPTTLQDVNAKGHSRTEGLGVVVAESFDVALIPLLDLVGLTLASATAIEAEAVAKCVNGVAQFDYGYDVIGLGLLGQEIPLPSDILALLLTVLGPDFVAADLLHAETPDTSPETTVVRTADGISVTAVRVVSDILGIDIPIGHAEARMPSDCGIPAERPPTGPEAPRPAALAATGGEMGMWPVMAFGTLGLAVILRRTMVQASRRSS